MFEILCYVRGRKVHILKHDVTFYIVIYLPLGAAELSMTNF